MTTSISERMPWRAWLALVLVSSLSCSREVLEPSTPPPPAPRQERAALLVSNTTAGNGETSVGYFVTLDRTRMVSMGVNGSVGFSDLSAGEHTVELSGVAGNCAVSEARIRTLTLTAGQTTQLNFTVSCGPPLELAQLRLVFATDTGLYAINGDGSGRMELARGEFRDLAVSPDGQRIAFTRADQVFIIGADGNGLQQVTTSYGAGPAWSPDGTQLVYAGPRGLSIIALTGGNPVRLTNPVYSKESDGEPVWSPDGSWIAFTHWDVLGDELTMIWVVNVDGTGETPIGPGEGWDPIWSPDGSRIAFLGVNDSLEVTVFSMARDGSGVSELYSEDGNHFIEVSDWSPDGRWIAMTMQARDGSSGPDIYLLGPSGGTLRVTADGGSHSPAFLRP